ncbi:hypothetical protein GGX14DRAFT_402653 [Mycena pura]|uniref:Uncharacterized protein n=1 Tax=Mycena pura TaxID=153505 RepID=A0AAD6Y5C1_9AGAR|nr:hypothetical protein GGX14DRAFT_402653 [Mycena pura]
MWLKLQYSTRVLTDANTYYLKCFGITLGQESSRKTNVAVGVTTTTACRASSARLYCRQRVGVVRHGSGGSGRLMGLRWRDSTSASRPRMRHRRSMAYAPAAPRPEEGHDPRDVDSAHELGESTALEHVSRLMSEHWHKARPYLLPSVDAARRECLKHERAQLVAWCGAVVIAAAAHVLRTAPRETWAYNPPNYAIETFPPLQALIQDPSDARLTEDDLSARASRRTSCTRRRRGGEGRAAAEAVRVANDNAWVCIICTKHYEGRVTRWTVMDHLHAIRNPIEGQHFIHGAERTPSEGSDRMRRGFGFDLGGGTRAHLGVTDAAEFNEVRGIVTAGSLNAEGGLQYLEAV